MIPRMRTAAGVLNEIKANDPKTEITLHYIRNIIKTNQVPVVAVGRKKLVDVDSVISMLSAGELSNTSDMSNFSVRQIRRVPTKV